MKDYPSEGYSTRTTAADRHRQFARENAEIADRLRDAGIDGAAAAEQLDREAVKKA